MELRMWQPPEDAGALSESGIEVWASVRECPERYFVSNLGRVASRVAGRKTRLLKNTSMSGGYQRVGIYTKRGAKPTTCTVHRLVLRSFGGTPPSSEHTDVRYLNGDSKDARLFNLAYGTRSESMLDVWEHWNSNREPTPADQEGATWYEGYTADDYLVLTGLELHVEGKLSISDLTRYWRCSKDVASNIVHGKTRQHVPRPAPPKKQKRRSAARKKEILALVAEGLNAAQINKQLDETLTPQAVYYYRSKLRSSGS
jgi:hypothetical protein